MGFAEFEMRVVKRGIKHGLSPEMLFHAARTRRLLSSPFDWMSRRARARVLQTTSAYAGFVDRKSGYRLIGPDDIPGIPQAIAAARKIVAKKISQDPEHAKKAFFVNVLTGEDLEAEPALMEFAGGDSLREIAASYFEEWPVLTTLGVFISPPNDTLEKSQMYHVDGMDMRLLKCFVNVDDVGPDNGPFTFIPADRSDEIRMNLGHRWRGGRISDEEVLAHAAPEDIIALTGPAGSGALVDTARCLHFGSRCKKGHRVVIMVNYARKANLMARKKDEDREGMSLLLGGH